MNEENELKKKNIRLISITMFLFSGLILHLISTMVYIGGIDLLLKNSFLFLIVVAFVVMLIGYGIYKLHIWSYYLTLLFIVGLIIGFVYNILIGEFPSIFGIIGFIGLIISFSFLRKNKKVFETTESKRGLAQKFSDIVSPNKEIILIFVILILIYYATFSWAVTYIYNSEKSICERLKTLPLNNTSEFDCNKYPLDPHMNVGTFPLVIRIAPMIGIPISTILESKISIIEIVGMLQWLVLLYLSSIWFHCFYKILPKVKVKFK